MLVKEKRRGEEWKGSETMVYEGGREKVGWSVSQSIRLGGLELSTETWGAQGTTYHVVPGHQCTQTARTT